MCRKEESPEPDEYRQENGHTGVSMKTITEPRKNIALLWKRRKPEQAVYRPMKYLLRAQVEDGLLLYNVVTSEMVLLEQHEARLFESLPAAYSPEMDELIARHFAVPEGFDESKSVEQLRALLKKLNPAKRVSGFTILPTTECNARCYYCFESDHPRCTMTDQIVEDTVAYIAKMCKGEPIQIEWFGGEPLVAHKQISQICAGLKQRKIEFWSTMVSNAYLFDVNLIRTAKDEWHLRKVQITLDGTEKVYNETKAYIQPKDNPYQRVLRNIDLLLGQEIAVSIRMNVTAKNAVDLSDLVDELAGRFGEKNGFGVYSHAIYENVGYDPVSYDDNTREWVDIQTSALDVKMREKKLLGSFARLPELRPIQCMADNDSGRLIYPDGTVGKCENMSSRESIGDIYRDIADENLYAQYKASEQLPGCVDCPLLPDCVNLKVCPETGTCSKVKVDWKLNRYAGLMNNWYQKYQQDASEGPIEEVAQCECES